jgi:hypothetical protein
MGTGGKGRTLQKVRTRQEIDAISDNTEGRRRRRQIKQHTAANQMLHMFIFSSNFIMKLKTEIKVSCGMNLTVKNALPSV